MAPSKGLAGASLEVTVKNEHGRLYLNFDVDTARPRVRAGEGTADTAARPGQKYSRSVVDTTRPGARSGLGASP